MRNETFNLIQSDIVTNYDLLDTLLGEEIGTGVFRKVFEHRLDPNLVVKIAISSDGVKCNAIEAGLWFDNIDWLKGNLAWVKKWFAPVVYASRNYNVIVMKKTEPKPSKKRPEEVPDFMTDVHPGNFGWIGNQFVCHDYGNFSGFMQYKNKFKKAYWGR